jgi:predicted protein tyrosine phosphatase
MNDYESNPNGFTDWIVIHACKEPYHRKALGYTGRAAQKNHPEYLFARRGNRLILNLVDAPDARYIPKELIDLAINTIQESLSQGKKILVHCNEGRSRSAGIGLLYLLAVNDLDCTDFDDAEIKYRKKYPEYNPNKGVRDFLIDHWQEYRGSIV